MQRKDWHYKMVSAVILAGGQGKRLWPKSRKNFPKQCISFAGTESLIEQTAERIKDFIPKKNIYISAGKSPYIAIKGMPMLEGVNYIIEPLARNTAAAIGLSAMKINYEKKDEIIAILSADQYIEDADDYIRYLEVAAEIAKEDKIVLIGIKPTRAETGYGYIQKGSIVTKSWTEISSVKAFREKPDKAIAEEYIKSREYLWNAGMFIAKTSVILNEIKNYMPELYSALEKIKKSRFNEKIAAQEFEKLESISIDYGVMEKAYDKLAVISGDFKWDDIGTWQSMERILELDDAKNAVDADVEGDNKGCIIIGDDKMIEMEGFRDLVVVDAEDCLLVARKNMVQDVKKIVEILENDEKLKKYTADFVKNPEFSHVQLSCENVSVASSRLVATLGLKDMKIEDTLEKIVIKNV
jgi:mannose-1-phosphate guanylyltransferase